MLAAVFGQIVFLVRGETNKEEFETQNMKAAFWIDLFSMLLWLATVVEGCLWCCATRKVTRRTDDRGNRADKVDEEMLDTQQQIDKLEKLDSNSRRTGSVMIEGMCINTPIDLDMET